MQLNFWGVRGSVPAPERATWRYGGNTPCLEIRAGDQLFILDAGTGIDPLGHRLAAEFASTSLRAYLFLTHYHWDHVQGLPFFEPLYSAINSIDIFGPPPQDHGSAKLDAILHSLFRAPFCPVPAEEFRASTALRELNGKSDFALGATRVRACPLNHPQGALAYRFDHNGASIVYATDHEPGQPEADRALRAFVHGADLLISDAHFLPQELAAKTGRGHGSWQASVALARDAGVKNLFLFHHEPRRADHELDLLLYRARQVFPHTWAAAEGMLLDVAREEVRIRFQGRRLSQRATLRVPVRIESTHEGSRVHEEGVLENVSFQGAYFVSPQPYAPQQPVDLAIPLSALGYRPPRVIAHAPAEPAEFHLRGYVLRTEPQTTNGRWIGVAVCFPDPRAAEANPLGRVPPGTPRHG